MIAELGERANKNPLPLAMHGADWHGKCGAEVTEQVAQAAENLQRLTEENV